MDRVGTDVLTKIFYLFIFFIEEKKLRLIIGLYDKKAKILLAADHVVKRGWGEEERESYRDVKHGIDKEGMTSRTGRVQLQNVRQRGMH